MANIMINGTLIMVSHEVFSDLQFTAGEQGVHVETLLRAIV